MPIRPVRHPLRRRPEREEGGGGLDARARARGAPEPRPRGGGVLRGRRSELLRARACAPHVASRSRPPLARASSARPAETPRSRRARPGPSRDADLSAPSSLLRAKRSSCAISSPQPPTTPRDAPKPGSGGAELPATFPSSDGVVLSGILHAARSSESPAPGGGSPSGGGGPLSGAGVVMCHPHPYLGGAKTNPLLANLARRLASLGAVCLRFDCRGVGESAGARTWMRDGEVADVLAAADFIGRRPDVRPGRVFVLGYSFGAALALAATERGMPATGPGEIPLSSSPPPRSRHPVAGGVIAVAYPFGVKSMLVPGTSVSGALAGTKRSPGSSARSLPKLFVIAGEDRAVCSGGAEAAEAALATARTFGARNVASASVPGADHAFAGKHRALAEECARWLAARMEEEPPPMGADATVAASSSGWSDSAADSDATEYSASSEYSAHAAYSSEGGVPVPRGGGGGGALAAASSGGVSSSYSDSGSDGAVGGLRRLDAEELRRRVRSDAAIRAANAKHRFGGGGGALELEQSRARDILRSRRAKLGPPGSTPVASAGGTPLGHPGRRREPARERGVQGRGRKRLGGRVLPRRDGPGRATVRPPPRRQGDVAAGPAAEALVRGGGGVRWGRERGFGDGAPSRAESRPRSLGPGCFGRLFRGGGGGPLGGERRGAAHLARRPRGVFAVDTHARGPLPRGVRARDRAEGVVDRGPRRDGHEPIEPIERRRVAVRGPQRKSQLHPGGWTRAGAKGRRGRLLRQRFGSGSGSGIGIRRGRSPAHQLAPEHLETRELVRDPFQPRGVEARAGKTGGQTPVRPRNPARPAAAGRGRGADENLRRRRRPERRRRRFERGAPLPQRGEGGDGGEPVRRRGAEARAVGAHHRGGAADHRRAGPASREAVEELPVRRQGGHRRQPLRQFRGGRSRAAQGPVRRADARGNPRLRAPRRADSETQTTKRRARGGSPRAGSLGTVPRGRTRSRESLEPGPPRRGGGVLLRGREGAAVPRRRARGGRGGPPRARPERRGRESAKSRAAEMRTAERSRSRSRSPGGRAAAAGSASDRSDRSLRGRR